MSIRVKEIEEGSSAEKLGLLPGEQVSAINGHRIENFLDLQYYGGDEALKIDVKRLNGEKKIFTIHDNWSAPLGIIPEDHNCRQCANKCIFCFIDQMPPQQRDTLYIKDDDYCFSFIFGNFITMTNLTIHDYEKIIEQRLSPLYISVHTTNPLLHKKMLGYQRDFDIMEKLRYLQENEIEFHTQIVIVPGYNDREELDRTLHDLDSLGESCLSIGIVPVGLTKYRQGLPDLRTVTEEEAIMLLRAGEKYERTWCSDEIYLKAGEDFPDEEFYEEYPQLENGIGMMRMLIDNWQDSYSEFIPFLKETGKKFVFISGVLAAPVLSEIIDFIDQNEPGLVRLQTIRNYFMGETVTVTGLITWQDIQAQLQLKENEIAVFCSNTFNTEGYTLDGVHMNDIARELGGKIIIVSEEFTFWEEVKD
ncbi:MAG: DUF512 domain-containing protein [Candidatus Cloacimonetes bacterium]|nr:DUF512 domain-containing protein [Candidatus Cloacimonadota bacterium]